jgi:hypothetical protein
MIIRSVWQDRRSINILAQCIEQQLEGNWVEFWRWQLKVIEKK